MANSRQVSFTPEFKRNLRLLMRKYPHIRADVEPLIGSLQAGETPGAQVSGTGYVIFKVRVANSDTRRGKSGGYRIIYYLVSTEAVILVTIYSKSEQSDISAAKIRQIIHAAR